VEAVGFSPLTKQQNQKAFRRGLLNQKTDLKGHGFSRAIEQRYKDGALAPEGNEGESLTLHQTETEPEVK
jgi:hypothetical protein